MSSGTDVLGGKSRSETIARGEKRDIESEGKPVGTNHRHLCPVKQQKKTVPVSFLILPSSNPQKEKSTWERNLRKARTPPCTQKLALQSTNRPRSKRSLVSKAMFSRRDVQSAPQSGGCFLSMTEGGIRTGGIHTMVMWECEIEIREMSRAREERLQKGRRKKKKKAREWIESKKERGEMERWRKEEVE